LETQDDKTNAIYKLILTAISVGLSMFFGWYISISTKKIASIVSCFVLILCAAVILATTYETIQSKLFKSFFGILACLSTLPLILGGFEVFWAIPLMILLLNAMVVRDMFIVKRDLKSLSAKKYHLKGV
jgi:hypothetical protein